jgi:DNA-binding CsgD family transcriptional regulator
MKQSYSSSQMAISLIAAMGRLDFQERLTQSLKEQLRIDAGLILLVRKGSQPRVLFNDWRTARGLSDIQAYLNGSYRQDPFYHLATDDERDGLYRLNQIAPDSFTQGAYYRDYYRHCGLMDEFNYLITLDHQTKVAISLCRSQDSSMFNPEEVELLRSISPVVEAAVVRHWRDLRPELLDADAGMLKSVLARAIGSFGKSILTERECQVAQLVLRGYSLKGAAELLGISPATVKLHRRNIYSKLDVNSQAELFSLFIDAVSSASNHYEDPLASYVSRRGMLTGTLMPT